MQSQSKWCCRISQPEALPGSQHTETCPLITFQLLLYLHCVRLLLCLQMSRDSFLKAEQGRSNLKQTGFVFWKRCKLEAQHRNGTLSRKPEEQQGSAKGLGSSTPPCSPPHIAPSTPELGKTVPQPEGKSPPGPALALALNAGF